MKHKILICISGILLMFVLTAAVSGERIVETANTIDQHTAIVDKPLVTTITAVEPDFGSTVVTTANEFSVSYAPNSPDAYEIPWQSVNSAGGEMTSSSYEMISSVGQGVIGYATSANYEAGMGYVYGLTNWEPSDCECGVWGDVTGDGNINPVDVVFMVNYVYKNIDQLVPYTNCPQSVGDITCDGNVNPVDVVFYVNFVYKNIQGFCSNPCP